MSAAQDVSLKDFFSLWIERVELLIDERDRRYEERFVAQSEAVNKAEKAQQEYNIRSNEFRAALDDQAKLMLPRNEADQRFSQVRELLDVQGKQVVELQRLISRGEGGEMVTSQKRSQAHWIVGLAITTALSLAGFALTIGLVVYQNIK